ncbi:FLYWCH-type zinc finger-containing protein 1 isoform X1 [Armigeres subalbatus]|uniref:FLYWCH-type zinc finger-containing protein 1 isoform X1 n=1 Tax=Armigeres subalbatus TaxID=124917 RepID=UPI002ED5732A
MLIRNISFVISKRGKTQLCVNGYLYMRVKTTEELQFWSCNQDKVLRCTARATTGRAKKDDKPTIKLRGFHNHKIILERRKAVFQYTVEDATEYRVFIRSQRGAPLLTLGNFIYRCERVRKTRSYWLCIRYKSSKCNGRVICQGNKIIKLTEHCHANDHKRISSSVLEETDLSGINLEEWYKQTLVQKRHVVKRK